MMMFDQPKPMKHFHLAGMPNATGLISRREFVSTSDAVLVALLKRAGAIPLGVTNTSELCMWAESNNHLYGIARNPYDLNRTPGGSSGEKRDFIYNSGLSVNHRPDVPEPKNTPVKA